MMIRIRAHPSSKRLSFRFVGEVLHAHLTEPAEGNMANTQLVKELARAFGGCTLVRGAGSRSKVVDVPLASIDEAEQRLRAAYL
ncbi:MAG: DUF167 domain-containing protein [Candidatus Aenigmatarchaeota archaeon]